MPDIEVVMTSSGALRGFTQADDQSLKRYNAWVKQLDPGEFFVLSYRKPRNVKLHRKFFAMLNLAFERWEPETGRKRLTYKGKPIEKNFEAFREQITIMAGFYEASYDLKGRVDLKAKSIAFDKMDDDEFGLLYEAVLKVLLQHVLTNYKRDDLERVVTELEAFGS